MEKMKQHAKHPKASKVLGCCTLCWGIAAALFIFSGGVAVFNLTVEDTYFSAPLKCWSGSSDTHRLSERCQMYPGSITDLRLLIPLMPFISSADKYVRLERNESWEVCYGYDENKNEADQNIEMPMVIDTWDQSAFSAKVLVHGRGCE